MGKIDYKKSLKSLYMPPSKGFVEVDVPEMMFVKVDGAGDPNEPGLRDACLKWLYGTSYAMKFAAKSELGRDYVVPPLEGLWWADDPKSFTARQKHLWKWTLMIMVPDFITEEMFVRAVEKTRLKHGACPPSLRFEPLVEGRALQILHIGSYDDEGPTLARLHDEVMPGLGLTFNGAHHEIYLSDPRRVAPDRLKTVLRQPVRPA